MVTIDLLMVFDSNKTCEFYTVLEYKEVHNLKILFKNYLYEVILFLIGTSRVLHISQCYLLPMSFLKLAIFVTNSRLVKRMQHVSMCSSTGLSYLQESDST